MQWHHLLCNLKIESFNMDHKLFIPTFTSTQLYQELWMQLLQGFVPKKTELLGRQRLANLLLMFPHVYLSYVTVNRWLIVITMTVGFWSLRNWPPPSGFCGITMELKSHERNPLFLSFPNFVRVRNLKIKIYQGEHFVTRSCHHTERKGVSCCHFSELPHTQV